MRRLGRRDDTPQTTIRVDTDTRDRLKLLMRARERQLARTRPLWSRQYGETAAVTMDDVVRELLRLADRHAASTSSERAS
jgi:hypothetical protein